MIDKIRKLYQDDNKEVLSEIKIFVSQVFSNNNQGNQFWSLGVNFLQELIILLGENKKYYELTYEGIISYLENDEKINSLLDNYESSKIRDIISLNRPIKNMLYDYIKVQLQKNTKFNSILENTNSLKENENILYKSFNNNIDFIYDDEINGYVAYNIIFNGIKVKKITLYTDLKKGFNILNSVIEKFNTNFHKLCAELEIDDYNSEWSNGLLLTQDELEKELQAEVEIEITNTDGGTFNMWFYCKKEELFGGHNPVLKLCPQKEYKTVGIE